MRESLVPSPLTGLQKGIANSYLDSLNKKRKESSSSLPDHGYLTISDKEIGDIERNPLLQEIQGQLDTNIEGLSLSAQALLKSPAWKKLYENAVPVSSEVQQLILQLDHYHQIQSHNKKNENIFLPLLDPHIREVVVTIFTRLPVYDASSVYRILSAGRIYGLFHRFCTQSVPLSTKNDQYSPQWSTSMFHSFLPKLGSLQADIVKINPEKLSKETMWRSNDQETRLRLANEMFDHVKQYIIDHPDEKVTIIEPGGGNAELSVILAHQIAKDPQTKGKANIIIREINHDMAEEGKDKIEQIELEENTDEDFRLDIDYIIGSADKPLQDVLLEIKKALEIQDKEKLSEFGLNIEEAEYLLSEMNDRKVIGGISTYTAGAMSNKNNDRTTATRVFDHLAHDVDAKDGLIIINDFSAVPPDSLLDDKKLTSQQNKQIKYLKKVDKSFQRSGLNKALEVVYGLWGEGVGHDTRQIWKVLASLKRLGLEVSADPQLRDFAILPTFLDNRYLKMPGFTETTLRCSGLSTNSKISIT
ncbi:MAG: hypothetical protein OEX81_01470 [Candidatus Pacebacteria bacterium]|nr:hypothetical protein [Candidatus Paceibacterota bacterium]